MKYLAIWAVLFSVAATITSTILNGFAGLVATALAMPMLICLAVFSVKGGPYGGVGTAIAAFIGSIIVAGLLEIIAAPLGTNVFHVWGGFWDWLWTTQGLWVTGGILVGSFVVTLVVGATSES